MGEEFTARDETIEEFQAGRRPARISKRPERARRPRNGHYYSLEAPEWIMDCVRIPSVASLENLPSYIKFVYMCVVPTPAAL